MTEPTERLYANLAALAALPAKPNAYLVTRTFRALRRAGIDPLRIARMTDDDLAAIRAIGPQGRQLLRDLYPYVPPPPGLRLRLRDYVPVRRR